MKNFNLPSRFVEGTYQLTGLIQQVSTLCSKPAKTSSHPVDIFFSAPPIYPTAVQFIPSNQPFLPFSLLSLEIGLSFQTRPAIPPEMAGASVGILTFHHPGEDGYFTCNSVEIETEFLIGREWGPAWRKSLTPAIEASLFVQIGSLQNE